MAKAKLSQIAATWIDEKKPKKQIEGIKEYPKKKQTFNLRVDAIKRLWMQRIRTDKTLSNIIDELVLNHLPAVDLKALNKKGK